ncbi:MAG: DUF29 domain-containing protein [Cyanobacterium sp.]
MTVSSSVNLQELYKIDDYLWIQETLKLLKEKKFDKLDLENLIEELDDLGSEKRHKVESLLQQIIRHLLLLEYWEEERERNYRHWRSEVTNFRGQISKRMTTNFYNYLSNSLNEIYEDAFLYVVDKSGLNIFPSQCPYTIDQLLDKRWFPDN